MRQCLNCNVTICDDTMVCPLCGQVLHRDGTEPKQNTYPELTHHHHTALLVKNITLFASIVAASTLFVLAYLFDFSYHLPLLLTLILCYVNSVLQMTVLGKGGYRFKLMGTVLFSVVLFAGIDYLTGYRGWSMTVLYPSIIILLDIIIGVLMIINRRNWQSYMVVQLISILLSCLPLLLVLLDVIRFPYLAYLAFGVSVFFFLGTLIIGDQRARNELKRRFHF